MGKTNLGELDTTDGYEVDGTQVIDGDGKLQESAIELSDGDSFPDNNGNEALEFGVVSSAINHVKLTNAVTTAPAIVAAAGGDTNVALAINAKGTGRIVTNAALVQEHSTAAINSTATATAAEVATGYITSTSAAGTTITLPTGTALGSELGAVQGTIHELYVDNTAGANTVTMAVSTNGILTDAATTTAASFGQLTVASGVTGQGRFTLMFSSATAFTFTRTA